MRPLHLCLSSSKGKHHRPRTLASMHPHQEKPTHMALTMQARPRPAMIPSHLCAFMLQPRANPSCLLWLPGNFTTVKTPTDSKRHQLPTNTEPAMATQAMNPSLTAKSFGKCHLHHRPRCQMLPNEAGHDLRHPLAKTPKARLSIPCSKLTSSSRSTPSLAALRLRSKHLSFCRHKSL